MGQVPGGGSNPVVERPRPGGSGQGTRALLRTLEIRHLYCLPHHPQTNGKLERFHKTLKAWLNLLVLTSPEALRAAMVGFIEFYKYQRYHEGIWNVTPADVYFGRREGILKRRKEQKQETLQRQLQYNLGQAPNPKTR